MVLAPKLNTTSPNNDTILVTWPPVENALLYTLCIIQEGSSSRLKVNTTDLSVTFDDLEAGATYCIKGTAWDSEGRAGDDLTVCQITRERECVTGTGGLLECTSATGYICVFLRVQVHRAQT